MEIDGLIHGKWIKSVGVTSHQCFCHLFRGNPCWLGLICEGVCGYGSQRKDVTGNYTANSLWAAPNINDQAGRWAVFQLQHLFSNPFCMDHTICLSIWALCLGTRSLLQHTSTHTHFSPLLCLSVWMTTFFFHIITLKTQIYECVCNKQKKHIEIRF